MISTYKLGQARRRRHPAGDRQASCRGWHSVDGVAARLGGDEFAILVPRCDRRRGADGDRRGRERGACRAHRSDAHPWTIQTCIGAALSQAGKSRPANGAEILPAQVNHTQAELALRWAKQAECNAQILYSRARDDRFRIRAILAHSLEHAIASNELELHYQPHCRSRSGRIVSAEALVRWKHPTLGMQRPDLFIPLGREVGADRAARSLGDRRSIPSARTVAARGLGAATASRSMCRAIS